MKTIEIQEKYVYAGDLILVNSKHPYHSEIADPLLFPVDLDESKVLLERKASILFSKLMDEIAGWEYIRAVSGWRSRQEQQNIYDQSMWENGAAFTDRYVARPGYSEHQTGLAIDLGLNQQGIDFIRPDFPYHGICQTFRTKAVQFGFIERYPKGKEDITGIAHEPWHFRFIGMPHAAIMAKIGFTLEEYHAFIKQYPYGKKGFDFKDGNQSIRVFYVQAAEGAETKFEIEACIPYSISGNNADGFVLTEWRNGYGKR